VRRASINQHVGVCRSEPVTGVVEGAGLILKGGSAASWAISWFNQKEQERTRAMQEGYRDNVRHEWRLERERLLAARLTALEENERNRTRLEALLGPEFFWVLQNYEFEAHREAIDERRRMLAFASAGSLNLELTLSEIARVERTIRELDPSNVRGLASMAEVPEQPEPKQGAPTTWLQHTEGTAQTRAATLRALGPSGEVLLAAGCVRTFSVSVASLITSPIEGALVTHTGALVLAVLDAYLRARDP
jgi:hypothetical protein